MDINVLLPIEIIVEILALPVMFFSPLGIVVFIINGFFIINHVVFLSSNKQHEEKLKISKDNVKSNVANSNPIVCKEISLEEMEQQMEKAYKSFNIDIETLDVLLQNYSFEQKNIFLDKLSSYCRKQLSNKDVTLIEQQYCQFVLSIVVKYKSKFI